MKNYKVGDRVILKCGISGTIKSYNERIVVEKDWNCNGLPHVGLEDIEGYLND